MIRFLTMALAAAMTFMAFSYGVHLLSRTLKYRVAVFIFIVEDTTTKEGGMRDELQRNYPSVKHLKSP